MLKRTQLFILLGLMALAWSGCASNQALTVRDVWARPGVAGGNSAVYMTIANPGNRAEALLSATSDVAAQVELHTTQMDHSGAMTMHHQESIPIPARGQVELKPGGLHVMLIGLERDLKAGDKFSLVLRFQHAGEMVLQVMVQEP